MAGIFLSSLIVRIHPWIVSDRLIGFESEVKILA